MLLDTLKEDCEYWISSYQALFMNECEMQLRLANYLASRQDHYDKVHVEYAVPIEMVRGRGINVPHKNARPQTFTVPSDFPWDNEMLYLDIVVEKGGKFAIVELKDGSASIEQDEAKLNLFGEDLGGIDLLMAQDAYDETMYAYWKDVHRIEVLTRIFPNVEGGVSLIVANNRTFWQDSGKNNGFRGFATYEANTVASAVAWGNSIGMDTKKKCPAFNLDYAYYCHWKPTRIPFLALKGKGRGEDHGQNREDRIFKYMITEIEKK